LHLCNVQIIQNCTNKHCIHGIYNKYKFVEINIAFMQCTNNTNVQICNVSEKDHPSFQYQNLGIFTNNVQFEWELSEGVAECRGISYLDEKSCTVV